METDFHIKAKINHNDLLIQLQGTFNGSSAFELANILKINSNISKSFFIDTDQITQIFPFGRAILNTELPKKGIRKRLHFTGSRAKEIIPEGCVLLNGNFKKKHVCTGQCKNCKCRQLKLKKSP